MAEVNDSMFQVTVDENRGCSKRCESCMRRGRLHHLITPKSSLLRYPENSIKVRYREYWLCDSCYAKFREAMEQAEKEA